MKICFIADAKSIHTQRFVKYFADNGHEVHVISHRKGKIDGELHYIGPYTPPKAIGLKTITQLIRIFFSTKKIIRRIRPDVLHALYIQDCGLFAALSNFHPFVLSVLGSDISIYPIQSRIYKYITGYVLRKADAVHANNKYATDILVRMGVSRGKIVEVQWGVDTSVFFPSAKSIDLKNYLGNGSSQVVISIRHHKPIYDIETLIRAAPYVLNKIPNVIFVLGGTGKLTKKLRKLSEDLNIKEHVKFVGLIPHDEIPMYLSSSDVFIDTFSTAEEGGGIGIGLLEAMSCGTPPIVASRPCISDGLHRWYHGEVFEKGNCVQLAAKIVEMLQNEKKQKIVGEKCRESAKKIGDWKKNMKQIEQLYQSLISRKDRRCGRK
jgi:glycosyltransferase involved in cell wall biosynthesis